MGIGRELPERPTHFQPPFDRPIAQFASRHPVGFSPQRAPSGNAALSSSVQAEQATCQLPRSPLRAGRTPRNDMGVFAHADRRRMIYLITTRSWNQLTVRVGRPLVAAPRVRSSRAHQKEIRWPLLDHCTVLDQRRQTRPGIRLTGSRRRSLRVQPVLHLLRHGRLVRSRKRASA